MRRPEGTSSWRVDTRPVRAHLLGRRADYVRPFPHPVLQHRRQYYYIIMISHRTIRTRRRRDRLGITCRVILLLVMCNAPVHVFVRCTATDSLRQCTMCIQITCAGVVRMAEQMNAFGTLSLRASTIISLKWWHLSPVIRIIFCLEWFVFKYFQSTTNAHNNMIIIWYGAFSYYSKSAFLNPWVAHN